MYTYKLEFFQRFGHLWVSQVSRVTSPYFKKEKKKYLLLDVIFKCKSSDNLSPNWMKSYAKFHNSKGHDLAVHVKRLELHKGI